VRSVAWHGHRYLYFVFPLLLDAGPLRPQFRLRYIPIFCLLPAGPLRGLSDFIVTLRISCVAKKSLDSRFITVAMMLYANLLMSLVVDVSIFC
jgi:hypothetical protein